MTVAIYARVSSDSQEARGTIGSQLEALHKKMSELGHQVVHEYTDDGYSGARLDRPGLDALRDAAEAGLFQEVWCLTPDRLARSYVYQILITDELARHGVQMQYLDAPPLKDDPEATLLVQVQGVIAEYERARLLNAIAADGSSGLVPVRLCIGSCRMVTDAFPEVHLVQPIWRSMNPKPWWCDASLMILWRAAIPCDASAGGCMRMVLPARPVRACGQLPA